MFAIVDYRMSFEIHGKTPASSFFSSGKCDRNCSAGPMRPVCIMAIRFRIHASQYDQPVCSGPPVITIFAARAFKKSSVV